MAVGSMLEVLARDCDVLERLKSCALLPPRWGIPALLPRPPPNSPKSAPGVSEIERPWVKFTKQFIRQEFFKVKML
jgi:hypothetical protein